MANKLDLADAQFIGFVHGRSNRTDLIGLVESMGLTKREWKAWLRQYVGVLSITDIEEINEHFNIKD